MWNSSLELDQSEWVDMFLLVAPDLAAVPRQPLLVHRQPNEQSVTARVITVRAADGERAVGPTSVCRPALTPVHQPTLDCHDVWVGGRPSKSGLASDRGWQGPTFTLPAMSCSFASNNTTAMIHDNAVASQAIPKTNGVAKQGEPAPVAQPPQRTLPDICYELRGKIDAFLTEDITNDNVLRNVQSQIRVSIGVIEEALRRYGLDHLSLSYNGGKDCLVLLILILACLPTCISPPTSSGSVVAAPSEIPTPPSQPPTSEPVESAHSFHINKSLQSIYIVSRHPFTEVEEFVERTAQEYNLDLKRYALPMRPALEAYLLDRPAIRAIFLGTRRTDPHGEFLSHFNPTDAGWPQFMRIHPVIDWHYVEIWAFIRHLNIPFCDLYNRGFTSLGGVTDTRPNPALAVGEGASKFRPAYELRDDDEERLGRDS
ncbi:3'-phosphoadenosine 5'-phosphosulfate sulfotransferase [Podospora pseudocomata]|uniref:FAD synthase n=1 Tax=Podospora pseudocomata TaxID=2093779 RepID=A0ABR0G5E7_9PEZI|nr:3'-phosphoadenosine 5'-phosphosulfate sulfotransferase [Podospora pseudocomata]